MKKPEVERNKDTSGAAMSRRVEPVLGLGTWEQSGLDQV